MTKLIQNKFFVGAICILLAAAVAFILLPKIYESQSETERIVRVTQDVPAGTVITSAMVASSEVGSYGLPESVLKSTDEAVGKIASENLFTGEYLLGNRVATEAEYAELSKKDNTLSAGQYLVTIEFPSTSSGIAGVLRSGSKVDVFEYVETTDEAGAEICSAEKVLSSMNVFDVYNADLQSLDDLDELQDELEEGDTTSYDFAPQYVVFKCTQSEVETLIRLERAESLHLALTKDGD